MTEKNEKPKSEIPYRTFTDPARKGTSLEGTCRVYEPHDYNRRLLEQQRREGRAANIPQVPTLGKTHTIAIRKPKQLDLIAKAKAIRAAAKAAEEAAMQGDDDVLPDGGVQFDALDD